MNSYYYYQSILKATRRSLLVGLSFTLLTACGTTRPAAVASAPADDVPSINHLALYVFDLPKSAAFYKDVLQLPQIPEPFHDGRHVWLRLGPHAQLHLIQGAAAVVERDKNTHLAFHVKDMQKFAAHLNQLNVRYGSWQGEDRKTTPRPDGITQVYMQDPDGYWVEVNDDQF